MHFNAGNCNSMLLQGWGFYINSVSSRIALYLGRGIGALGSFIYAKRYSSWYGTSLLLLMWKLVFVALVCKLYNSLFAYDYEVLSDHTFCIVTLQVLHFYVIQAEYMLFVCIFLVINSLAHTLSSNKAWNPALYCINLTFCVLVKQNAEIWISADGWNVISLWSSKTRLIICLIPSGSLIYLGQIFFI